MTPDALFNIASMTKPVTATAILMLQDDGSLKLSDPVAKYIPEFTELKTPSGQRANLTLLQLVTHTSGLGEASGEAARSAHSLAELIPLFLAAPMQYEPGAKWKYTQSGSNTAARSVEVARLPTAMVAISDFIGSALRSTPLAKRPGPSKRAMPLETLTTSSGMACMSTKLMCVISS